MTMEQMPRPQPLGRLLGIVWLVAGLVAIVVGLAATVVAISIFGVLAALLGAALIGFAKLRRKSEARTARTLAGNPPAPSSAPYAAPPPGADDPAPARRSGSSDVDQDTTKRGTRPSGASDPDVRVSASDVEDGTGEPITPRDRPS